MFHNPSSFAVVSSFQDQWQKIREEYRGLNPAIVDIHRNGSHEEYFAQVIANNGWVPSWQVGSTDKNYGWLTYALGYEGHFPNEAEAKFPTIMALLKKYPQVKACAFSKMRPLSFIAPHAHVELGGKILTFHLGIDVTPATAYLSVEGAFEEESNGKAIVFDGSASHFAINMGNEDRVIMYMEFDQSA